MLIIYSYRFDILEYHIVMQYTVNLDIKVAALIREAWLFSNNVARLLKNILEGTQMTPKIILF